MKIVHDMAIMNNYFVGIYRSTKKFQRMIYIVTKKA
jgi:hypothetical protein